MKLILFLLLLMFVIHAMAQDYVTLAGASRHYDGLHRHSGYCEVNPGIGVEVGWRKDLSLTGGIYHNSLCDTTIDFGIDWMPMHVGGWRAGTANRVFLGYGHPLIGPVPKVESPEIFSWRGNMYVVPGVFIGKKAIVFAFEIKKEF